MNLAPRTLAVLTALPALAAPTNAQATAEDLAARIDAFDQRFDPMNRISGVLLIAKGDDVLLHRAYGYADREHGVENQLDTRFCIASINKPMTQMVVMQLAAEGKVGLSDPIEKWLPDFPRGDEITFGNLFRHRAGIPHRVTTPLEESQPRTASEMVEFAATKPLLTEPGARGDYSSAGYSVLARVIECIEGKPFRDVLRTRIFEPLELQNTCDPDGTEIIENRAHSYVQGRHELLNAPLRDMSFLVGAGSVVSTAADLLKLLRGVRDEKLPGVKLSYLAPSGDVRWTGSSNGFHAWVDYHPAEDLTTVFVGNSWAAAPGHLRGALPQLVRGADVPAPSPRPELVADPEPAALAAYVGRYEGRPGSRVIVRIYRDWLMFADSVVLPIGPDRFYHQGWMAEIRFVRDAGGRVTGAERHLDGVTRYRRVGPAPK